MNKIQKGLNIMCSALFLFVAVMAILESVFQFETRFYDSTTRALVLPWDLTGPLAEKRLLAAVCLLLFGCFVSCIADISDIKQGNFTIAGAVNTITSIGSVIICICIISKMLDLYDFKSVELGKKGIALLLPIAKGNTAGCILVLSTMLGCSVTSLVQDIKAIRGGG
jgi:hypothetical protein